MVTEALFLLPFDPVLQVIETGMPRLPAQARYNIVVREFIGHLLDELSVKIWDRDATAHTAPAVCYLKKCGVEEWLAETFAQNVFNAIFDTVVSYFPNLTFQELAAGRFVLEPDNVTLLVYLKQAAYA
jgi:hypothetical protein